MPPASASQTLWPEFNFSDHRNNFCPGVFACIEGHKCFAYHLKAKPCFVLQDKILITGFGFAIECLVWSMYIETG